MPWLPRKKAEQKRDADWQENLEYVAVDRLYFLGNEVVLMTLSVEIRVGQAQRRMFRCRRGRGLCDDRALSSTSFFGLLGCLAQGRSDQTVQRRTESLFSKR